MCRIAKTKLILIVVWENRLHYNFIEEVEYYQLLIYDRTARKLQPHIQKRLLQQ